MLKNALIFAIGSLIIAFGAPALIGGPGARPAATSAPAPAETPVSPSAATDPAPGYRQASVAADSRGQYRATALIEGQGADVIIDTGASVVALTAETAARLGVSSDPSRPKWRMSTANGVVAASPVTLKSVSLGAVYMNEVQAVVMPPGAASANLLGASFLRRLVSIEQRDGVLILRQ